MKDITNIINEISNFDSSVKIVGVSKNRSLKEIESLYQQGVVIFGENKAQELISKANPQQPWQWHFIGHLQSNKVKSIIPIVSLIHSVDSLKLAKIINKECNKLNKVMDICIQVNVLNESTKSGCELEKLDILINEIVGLSNICLRGFMIMGPTDLDEKRINEAFSSGKQLFDKYKLTHSTIYTLSMGMSQDYEIALRYGSTMLRLGSILFD